MRSSAPQTPRDGLKRFARTGCRHWSRVAGLAAISWFDPAVFVWILPVAVPLFLSIPLSVYSGSVSLGRASYRFGIFRIPEEESSPPELDDLRTVMEKQKQLKVPADGFHFLLSDAVMHSTRKNRQVSKSLLQSS